MGVHSQSMADESQKRKAGGRFEISITHEDVLSTFEAVKGPVVTSRDVAEVCDCSGKTAKRKLEELSAEGRIQGRETGGRTMWWESGEHDRPAIVGLTHDFQTDEVSAVFENGVEVAVTKHGETIETTISHPAIENESANVQTMDRSPTSVGAELLSDFYNEDEDRDVKVPALDRFMKEASDDE
jgi:hypothetical protein